MGLWSDLFGRAAHGEGALLSAGRVYAKGEEPHFPDLGVTRLVSTDEPVSLVEAVTGSGKPCIVEIYSNCCCGAAPSKNMEALARKYGGEVDFRAVCVNGLVADPPPWHPEAGLRGAGWPRAMAAELEDCVGGMGSLNHMYLEVDDGGDHIVGSLGLCTVPTHVLVGPTGEVVTVLKRGQLPTSNTVEWLQEGGPGRAG